MKAYNIRKIRLKETDSTNHYAATLPVPGNEEFPDMPAVFLPRGQYPDDTAAAVLHSRYLETSGESRPVINGVEYAVSGILPAG